jgi:hypothetical protein
MTMSAKIIDAKMTIFYNVKENGRCEISTFDVNGRESPNKRLSLAHQDP